MPITPTRYFSLTMALLAALFLICGCTGATVDPTVPTTTDVTTGTGTSTPTLSTEKIHRNKPLYTRCDGSGDYLNDHLSE